MFPFAFSHFGYNPDKIFLRRKVSPKESKKRVNIMVGSVSLSPFGGVPESIPRHPHEGEGLQHSIA